MSVELVHPDIYIKHRHTLILLTGLIQLIIPGGSLHSDCSGYYSKHRVGLLLPSVLSCGTLVCDHVADDG